MLPGLCGSQVGRRVAGDGHLGVALDVAHGSGDLVVAGQVASGVEGLLGSRGQVHHCGGDGAASGAPVRRDGDLEFLAVEPLGAELLLVP